MFIGKTIIVLKEFMNLEKQLDFIKFWDSKYFNIVLHAKEPVDPFNKEVCLIPYHLAFHSKGKSLPFSLSILNALSCFYE